MEEEQKQDYREHLINTIDMLIDSGISVYDIDVVNKKAIRYNYVPKQKVKDKIKELKNEGNYRTNENPRGRIHFAKEPCDYKIEALEELLEEK